ncbi:tetratricopeptide repeat protein [Spirosoma jeollabukense]
MKYFCTLLLLLTGGKTALAQIPKIDSLNRLISQAKTDTARINLINAKTALLTQVNIDSSISLGLKTIEQAKRINYKKGEADARMRLSYSYSLKGNYAVAKANLKRAEALSLTDSAQLIRVYSNYGATYGMQSKYDSSIAFLEKSRIMAERLADSSALRRIYMNIGISYSMQSNLPQALQYLQKSLIIAEALHDIGAQAFSLVNIANTYKTMGNVKESVQTYQKGLRLAKQESFKNVELNAYANLADIYDEMHDTQKAYETAIKAASLAKEIGDDGMQATSLAKAAKMLADQKKFTQAAPLIKQAITIADASNQPLNIHQAYSNMGYILKQQNRCGQAIPFYEKSFAVLKETDIYDQQTGESYQELAACYEQTGNYPKALAAFKKSAAIADSVRSKENVQKTTELTMTYAFDKKQQLAQVEQQKQNVLAEARQRALLWGLGFVLLLAAVSFYAYRSKQKANLLLQFQKQQLETQKLQLEDQKQQLQATLTQLQTTQRQLLQAEKMATMGKLTKGIVDRILNPLNYINNFSHTAQELLQETQTITQRHQDTFSADEQDDLATTTTMLEQNLTKIHEHGSSTARILQDMQKLLKERSSSYVLIDLNPYLAKQIDICFPKALANYPSLPIHLDLQLAPQPLPVSLLPYEFSEVLASLVDNACYALAEKCRRVKGFEPRLDVSTALVDDQVRLQVRDNGRGIPPKEVSQLFSPFFTTKPTAKGTGLGLYMSKDVVEHLQGQMQIDSVEDQYTQVTILLPLKSALATA